MRKYILLIGLVLLSFSAYANNKEYWREKITQKYQAQQVHKKNIQRHKINRTDWLKNKQKRHKEILSKKADILK